ncbi:MAG: beta-ketoacyl-ACP synthase III [bacterium]|jgi:3-oxoacyl-[acyl-carrier-protein] synthase-3
MVRAVGIAGTGTALPERILTNADLEKMVDTSDEWIRTRTGICQRYIADADTATSDLAAAAAREALAAAGTKPEEVDLILVATASPDMLFPSTACFVQAKLGAARAAAFDLSAGCTGFLYGLTTGAQFIRTGMYDTVLVIGAETLSKLVNWKDRSTCVIFGDAAGAAVLKPTETGKGFLSFVLGADGSGGDLLKVPAGGSRLPATAETVAAGQHYIHMAGNEVFKFAVRAMGDAALAAIAKAGLTKADIDYLIPHQANSRIIDASVRRLEIAREKVHINLNNFGNTSSASVAVALDEALRDGKVKPGDRIVMVAFGAGLTWGATVMEW